MESAPERIDSHYGRGGVLDSILRALRESGKDVNRLSLADLAPVDQFHIRGREATVELASRAALKPGLRVLDVGCGLGGSVRYLASQYQCQVTGIDLTKEYVDTASDLAGRVGLGQKVEFRHCSALDMPFDDGSFDVVWTEHVQMNIADKHAFYAEIARVLAPGGLLLFHDIFQGRGGPVLFPVPWADDSSISHLVAPEVARDILGTLGFTIREWEDKSQLSLDWFVAAVDKLKRSGSPPLGLHLLMGNTAKAKFENQIRNLRDARIVVVQSIAER